MRVHGFLNANTGSKRSELFQCEIKMRRRLPDAIQL